MEFWCVCRIGGKNFPSGILGEAERFVGDCALTGNGAPLYVCDGLD